MVAIPHESPPSLAPTGAQFLNRILRNDFNSFLRKTFGTLAPSASFLSNWHIQALAFHLDQVRQGVIKRLIITMPPRSLKSIAASVALPAFIHGHDPSRHCICVSYGQDLSTKHQNDYRLVLGSDWYQRAFPSTRISAVKDSESETLLTGRGTRIATSIGGTLTGRGADFIIIDDPLKPADALSAPKREAVNEWFGSTLMSRLNDKQTGAIVIVTQRVHSDDLVGYILGSDGDDRWTVLTLPAIAPRDQLVEIKRGVFHPFKEGEVLHPEREPRDVLEALRREMGSDIFQAQYLQCPVPPGGNFFKRSWIERYETVPSRETNGKIVQSWDTASKTGPQNDWSVCTTWLRQNERHYLLDVVRERLDYPALLKRATELGNLHKPSMILVEDTNIGTALGTQLRSHGLNVKLVTPVNAKEARASVEAAKFEGGLVVFPRNARWLTELEAELFAFPQGRHDDQVDSIVQALAYKHSAGLGSHYFNPY